MSDDMGLVSIVMPSYNTERYIYDSIQSVINQTYKNWELIIIDDCSTDGTDDIIKRFNDDRIKYIKNENNLGAAISRNRAIKEAKGKWIAFLDSDDLWQPEKLEKQIVFMIKNNYHFSYTNYFEIDEDGNLTGIKWTGPKKINKLLMYTFNYMGCLTVMYDREYVGTIEIANLKKRNDYAIWLKVVKKCPAYLLKEELAHYRIRMAGSIMNRKKSPLSRIKYNYIMFKEGEKKSILTSIFYTILNCVFGIFKRIFYKKRFTK